MYKELEYMVLKRRKLSLAEYPKFRGLLWDKWIMFFVDVDWGAWSRKTSYVEGFMQQFGPINRNFTFKSVMEGKGRLYLSS